MLAEPHDEHALRVLLAERLSYLLRADHYASYLWSEVDKSFIGRVALNMSDSNLATYEAYYQFRDPITHRLRERAEPTLVTQIMPQHELVETEFFQDFLSRDGLYWGVNLHVRVAGECTGDLRIWRGQNGGDFGERELQILELVAPAFRTALRRSARNNELAAPTRDAKLTEREEQIARLICTGLADKEIAQTLAISLTTVRTHIKRAFRKLQVDNRVKLAGYFR